MNWRAILQTSITISALEFDVLWTHLRLPAAPHVIKVPSPGTTHAQRRELEHRAWAELVTSGLGGPHDLDRELEQLLVVLAHADREIDARIWVGASLRVLAVASGQHAALAMLAGDRFTLQPASAGGVARAALSALPAAPAGTGRSVTLPAVDLDIAAANAGADPAAFERALRARGIRLEDARLTAQMTRDMVARGQFGAAATDVAGRRHRAGTVIGFHDTPSGRYLQTRRTSNDGRPWSTIAPTDGARLLAQVDQLLTTAIPTRLRHLGS